MYVDDYRELSVETRKNIYNAYAKIISASEYENNVILRDKLSGILYENDNNVYVMKIFKPEDITDTRLTYNPIEISKIGKNKKVSIPVKVDGITKK